MASENDHHTHKSICNACLKQAGCRSLADTVPQTGTIVLGHIVGDGDTKSCIHKYRKLIHFRRCRISGNCLCSQCINGSLHGKLADAHNRHLKSLFGTAEPLILIPASFLGGGAFCLLCDLIARTAFAPTEVSISSVTAVFGAPIVIYMMIHRKAG